MSNHWNYEGMDCIEVNDYTKLKEYLDNAEYSNLIHFTSHKNEKENKLDWNFYLGYNESDRFINQFDPTEPDVEFFLKEISKYCKDFKILIFDYYARNEFSDSWYILENVKGKLSIKQMNLVEVDK